MRQRYFKALATSASSLDVCLRFAIPLTAVMTFLSAAGVVMQQFAVERYFARSSPPAAARPIVGVVVVTVAGLVAAIANPRARVEAMVGLSMEWGEIHNKYKPHVALWRSMPMRQSPPRPPRRTSAPSRPPPVRPVQVENRGRFKHHQSIFELFGKKPSLPTRQRYFKALATSASSLMCACVSTAVMTFLSAAGVMQQFTLLSVLVTVAGGRYR